MKHLFLIAITAALFAAPAFAAPEPQAPILGEWQGLDTCASPGPQPVAFTVTAEQGAEDAPPTYTVRVSAFPGQPDTYNMTATYEPNRRPFFVPPTMADEFPARGMWHLKPRANPYAPRLALAVSLSGDMVYGYAPGVRCGREKQAFSARRTSP